MFAITERILSAVAVRQFFANDISAGISFRPREFLAQPRRADFAEGISVESKLATPHLKTTNSTSERGAAQL